MRLRFAAVSEVPTPWLCLQHDLREHGIDPDRLPRAPAQTMADNIAALGKRRLDVVQVFEPYVSMVLGEDAGECLYAASARGPTVYTTFISTRAAIERHRAAFAGMTRAIAQMQRWLAGHSAEDLAEVTAPFFPGIARELLVSSLRRYLHAGIWSNTIEVSRAGFARLADSLLSGGYISRMPNYEDCVDLSLG
jgi:NitT/TauT family transport system substrate-binding protein